MEPTCVALIPARAGSHRIPGKNIRPLAGYPLLAYAIGGAIASGVFQEIIVSTDSDEYAEIARHYGATVPRLRPAEYATAESPDIEWVYDVLTYLTGRNFGAAAILRPTSPFRQPETIQRAWAQFKADFVAVDSLRAVQLVSEHPGKMWRLVGSNRITPLLPFEDGGAPWHSRQYKTLPEVWVQNASLEIVRVARVFATRSIAGHIVAPFFTEGYEGLDVNTEADWERVEHLVATKRAKLPPVYRSVIGPHELSSVELIYAEAG